MPVSLTLRREWLLARHAPSMLLGGLSVPVKLRLTVESKQTGQTHEPVVNRIVVFEVVLQPPLIFEGAETQVTKGLMASRVVDVILEAIAVFEYADAKVAIVLMIWCLLDVVLKRNLIGEPDTAGAAPVLVRIVRLVAGISRSRDSA